MCHSTVIADTIIHASALQFAGMMSFSHCHCVIQLFAGGIKRETVWTLYGARFECNSSALLNVQLLSL